MPKPKVAAPVPTQDETPDVVAQAIREGCHVLAAAIRELALAQYGVQATDSHGREVHPSHRWNGAVCIFCSGWAGDADALEPCGARKQE